MKKEASSSSNTNSAGIASVILGLVGITLIFSAVIGFLGGLVLGIVGLIFGIIQAKKARNKWAIWGIILSIMAIGLSMLAFIWVSAIVAEVTRQIQDLQASGGLEALGQLQNVPQ